MTEDALARDVALKSGLSMPAVGLGTWRMGEDPDRRGEEIAAIRRAVERRFRHIDTAEMYADGEAERIVGEAIAGLDRDRLFLCSKVYPWNATEAGMAASCAASLDRRGTDRLDLYLLHWPGGVDIAETLAGARGLLDTGLIRAFGVSNVDARGLARLVETGDDAAVDANQVMYNPARRGVEFDLLPAMAKAGIAGVAYTPIEPAAMARNRRFAALAEEVGLTPAQLALAWHTTHDRAVPIPKAATIEHVDALAEAAAVRLDEARMAAIDEAFPPPTRATPLDIV
ncbi:MAG: aldo/keto reductase [Paracoccaceae bacterium]